MLVLDVDKTEVLSGSVIKVLSWFWLLNSFCVIWWVGICIRFESPVIVKLRVFCTISSENSDVS